MIYGRDDAWAPGRRQIGAKGRMTRAREAWVHLWEFELVLYRNDCPDQYGDEFALNFRIGKRIISFKLTELTLPELSVFRDFLNRAIESAEPICRERDRIAEDAYQRGDDTYARSYRDVPRIHTRQRAEREHGEGVRERPEGVSTVDEVRGDEQSGSSSQHDAEDGPALAERDTEGSGTKDDVSEVDESESLSVLGWSERFDSGELQTPEAGPSDSPSDS